jgi:hypothetical protein
MEDKLPKKDINLITHRIRIKNYCIVIDVSSISSLSSSRPCIILCHGLASNRYTWIDVSIYQSIYKLTNYFIISVFNIYII